MEGNQLAFFENCVERATALAATCGWLAFGGGAEAAVGVAIGGAGLAAVVSDAVRRHGPESEAALKSIRKRIAADLTAHAKVERWDTRADLEAADASMERALAGCFLDRKALAASARSPEGFPGSATKLILARLAERESATFGQDGPRAARDFADLVVRTALEAAIENESYFKNLEPHLLMEMLRGLGTVEERVGQIGSQVDLTYRLVSEIHANRMQLPPALQERLDESSARMEKKQDLLLMKRIHSEVIENVLEDRNVLTDKIVEFVRHYRIVHYPDELLEGPWDALVHVASFVCRFEPLPDDSTRSLERLVEEARIGNDVAYGTYLRLQSITLSASRIWDGVREVWDSINIPISGLYQIKWESSVKIHWLWTQYPIYSALERKVARAITEGQIKVEPSFLKEVIAAFQETPPGYPEIERVPWSLGDTNQA